LVPQAGLAILKSCGEKTLVCEAIQSSEHLGSAGPWWTLKYEDGEAQKFQASKWGEFMKEKKFNDRVMQLLDEKREHR